MQHTAIDGTAKKRRAALLALCTALAVLCGGCDVLLARVFTHTRPFRLCLCAVRGCACAVRRRGRLGLRLPVPQLCRAALRHSAVRGAVLLCKPAHADAGREHAFSARQRHQHGPL